MALVHIGFFSEALGMCTSCEVILPQPSRSLIGMETHKDDEKPAKVLWLLHGASDDETIWQRRTSIERYVAPLNMAVVMPAAQLSSYSDMAHGQKFFTYIADELPRIMCRFFRFSGKREDNFIAGLSMGGGGCLKIGLSRPQSYAAIGCLSAGIFDVKRMAAGNPHFAKMMERVIGDRAIEGTAEDPKGAARKLVEAGGPFPRVFHAWGTSDFVKDTAEDTRAFFQSFQNNPFDYTFEEDEGAHTWEYWDEHIQHFLKYIEEK